MSTAPDSSKPILAEIQKSADSIPSPMATLASSPTALEGYRAVEAVWENGSFTTQERQIILFAASVENHCRFCTADHSTALKTALRTPAEIVFAIRHNIPVPDAKFNALVVLVKELVRGRGYARKETIQNFMAVGYRKEQVVELLVGIALKTISNYLDHISRVPVDPAFAEETNESTHHSA